ncbi:hypothetical protein KSS87_011111 [Heliosperma pusillum]|nr:hypothetical protein KSS87_011111 [Heliosperma pusillum]
MGESKSYLFIVFALLALAPLCFSYKTQGAYLYPQFYDQSCPHAQEIVKLVVAKAIARDPRMAASLVRLLFHDCFVQGCDASLLLDNSGVFLSEKRSNPNRDSVRGFEVLDEIKVALEEACPLTVSCADILALAARDSTVLAGGPYWEVPLGRRDSLGASLSGSNNNIPAPNFTFPQILGKFNAVGLDLIDLVALSGLMEARIMHFAAVLSSEYFAYASNALALLSPSRGATIAGLSITSISFSCMRIILRQRLYNQNGNGKPDLTLNPAYASELRTRCPPSGGDQNLFVLDISSPFKFDNGYYKNILAYNGLLNSDEVLLTQSHASMQLVKQYAENNELFFEHFASSMIKMGNISPLTGNQDIFDSKNSGPLFLAPKIPAKIFEDDIAGDRTSDDSFFTVKPVSPSLFFEDDIAGDGLLMIIDDDW